MQIQKDNIRKQILTSAEKLFLEKGFTGTTMRGIATDSNIVLSNIYNYFKSKEDIFRAIVQPAVTDFKRLYIEHHSQESMDLTHITSEINLDKVFDKYMASEILFKKVVDEHIDLIINNKNRYKLLFFKSRGSSYERFKDDLTDFATKQTNQYMAEIKDKCPWLNIDMSDFFIHLQISGMLTLFEGLLMHEIKREDIEPIITEYMKFNIAGLRGLIKT